MIMGFLWIMNRINFFLMYHFEQPLRSVLSVQLQSFYGDSYHIASWFQGHQLKCFCIKS